MKRVIIVHCWGGNHSTNWYPWLRQELKGKGFEVLVPDMPNTESPTIDTWVNKLIEIVGTPDENTYFIGHSIGCQTILRYLEKIDTEIGGAVFVAGWFNLENLEDKESAETAKPWIGTPINLQKIREVLPKSILLISKDDPYGATEENIRRFNEFVTNTSLFERNGHFTETKEPEILSFFENFTQE